MIMMANWSEAEIPEGNSMWQLKNKLQPHETNMPLEIILKEAAQKMNEKFSSIRVSHGMRVPFERSNNQLINTNIFG
jgi:hypothetical protein